jgi:catechol 2,3-dioxygenase-like lactoylglutathione lyase family enzyme
MKVVPTLICLAVTGIASAATSDHSSSHSEGTTTAAAVSANAVSLGPDMNLVARRSERDRIRRFYRDILGFQITKTTERIDIFAAHNGFYLGVTYADDPQSEEERRHSIWLELRAERPEELKEKILKFGIAPIDFWDKGHFYFQAPGGQVYRLVGAHEDMTKWQR